MMASLFDYAERYPQAPGHQGGDTSQDAAVSIASRAGDLRDKVLVALFNHGLLATFELPALTGATYRAIQPRTSELRAAGLIEDSGERRTDPETGRKAIVWRLR